MAGSNEQTDADAFDRPLRDLGITAQPAFRSDLLATFFSGTYRDAGYALVSGTGAAAIRVEAGTPAAASDGLGWLLGDHGSAFWIGRHVVRAALADLDGRAKSTALTGMVLAELHLSDTTGAEDHGRPADLRHAMDTLYAMCPVQLARFARLAFEAVGDETALAIVRDAADALATTLGAVLAPRHSQPCRAGRRHARSAPRAGRTHHRNRDQ